MYHTSKIITTAGVDLQTMGKDFLWVGRAETRAKQFGGVNKTAVGVTAARLVIEGFLPRKVCTALRSCPVIAFTGVLYSGPHHLVNSLSSARTVNR